MKQSSHNRKEVSMNLSDKLKSLKSALTEKPEETDDFEGELTFDKQEHGFENGTFLNSLDELSENDIELNAAAEQSAKLSMTEIMRRIVFYSCFAVFIVKSTFCPLSKLFQVSRNI